MKTTMSQGETVSHTPGPWKITWYCGSTSAEIETVATEDGKYRHITNRLPMCPAWNCKEDERETITDEDGREREYSAEACANARLIAAAPDLLEACKGVFALFAQPLETSSHTQWALWNDPETVPEWRALRDAIDRATTQKEGAK